MTPSCTPTIEQIKSGAKSVKNTLQNRFGITVNHTQALELSAVAYGYKDFHVASAAIKPKVEEFGNKALFEIKQSDIVHSIFKNTIVAKLRRHGNQEVQDKINALIAKHDEANLQLSDDEFKTASDRLRKYAARFIMGYGDGYSSEEANMISLWFFDTLGGNPLSEFNSEYEDVESFQVDAYFSFVRSAYGNFGGGNKLGILSAWDRYINTRNGYREIVKAVGGEDLITDEILFVLGDTIEGFKAKSYTQRDINNDMLRWSVWLDQLLTEIHYLYHISVLSTSGYQPDLSTSTLFFVSENIKKPMVNEPRPYVSKRL